MERELFLSAFSQKKSYIKYPIALGVGFILAWTTLLGRTSPFAAAFSASLGGSECVFALIGSVAAFVAKGELLASIPHIAAMLVICGLRLFAVHEYSRAVHIGTAVLAGISVAVTNLVISTKPSDIIIALAFGVVAGVTSFCLILTYRAFASERSYTVLKPANAASLGIVFAFGAAALSAFEFFFLNVGVILAAFTTLCFASKFRYAGGAICGAVAALGISIGAPTYVEGAIAVTIGGIGCGLFNRLGKLTQAAGFVLFSGIAALLLGIEATSLNTLADVMAASVLFVLVPTEAVTGRFRKKTEKLPGTELSEVFAQRLGMISGTIEEVKLAIDKTAEVLDKRNTKDISWVYNSACDTICRKCRYNMRCWGEQYNDNAGEMMSLMAELRKGKQAQPEDLPRNIKVICGRREQLCYAINTKYSEFTATAAQTRKVGELRGIMTAQLSATQKMLDSMSDEFGESKLYDRSVAQRIELLLSDNGIHEAKAAAVISDGKLAIEAYGKGRLSIGEEELCDLAITSLQRELDLPDITYDGSGFRMTMFERAQYGIEYGGCQLSRGKEKTCGDYYDSFVDGKGYAYVILSDGMGSGSRARIDSSFACGMMIKLLRTGMGFDAALEMLNNSLLVKSADESFATLDICRLDLFTGKAVLYKAGGAATYVFCNKKAVRLSGKGLPVGISHTPRFEQQSFSVSDGDIVVMTSDGAELNLKWLENRLSESGGMNLEELSEEIASSAKFAGGKEREDDVTVVTVRIIK